MAEDPWTAFSFCFFRNLARRPKVRGDYIHYPYIRKWLDESTWEVSHRAIPASSQVFPRMARRELSHLSLFSGTIPGHQPTRCRL